MRQKGWRLFCIGALILVMGMGAAGWPAPAYGQDSGGLETETPEAGLDEAAPPGCPEIGREGLIVTPTPAVDAAVDLTGTPPLEETPADTEADAGLWCLPFNVSRSGAASRPALAAEPDGTLHAMWWDEFDGTKVAYYTPEVGWSQPQTALQITGGRRLVEGRSVRLPPTDLQLIASASGWVHAFWLDDSNNLRYARARTRTGLFALGPSMALNPLIWDVSLDSSDDLHLIFVRPDNTPAQPAGVYYRTSTNDGAGWRVPVALDTSLYYRALPASDAFVNVAGDGAGLVMATWEQAELRRSYYTWSTNGGQTFREGLEVEQLDQSPARRARALPAGGQGGQFLRIWETGDACALYQQQTAAPEPADDADASGVPDPAATAAPSPAPPDLSAGWSDPARVLDSLGGCLVDLAPSLLPDGRLLATLAVSGSRPLLTTWDGSRWADPVSVQISFVEAQTARPVTLDCLKVALAGETLAVLGCDPFGDVWVTTSRLALPDLLPALTTAWSAPVILSPARGDSGLPVAAADSAGQAYAMFSQSAAPGQPAQALMHSSGDGVSWPAPVSVLEAGQGQVERPVLAAGPGGLLHAVWSGGFTGQTFYSHAFVRDARVPTGWAAPRELPAPRPIGGWPDMVVDQAGILHVVYVVPLNEDRGVYYTRSEDQGESWSDYVRVFDAAQAGWAMVRGTRLAVDDAGRLHLVWVRAALPGTGTPLGVFYARSEDKGATWSAPVEVGGLDSDNPRVVAAGSDAIHLAWTRPAAAGLELLHQWSPDGGQTWSRSAPLLGVRRIGAPDFGMVADGTGTVYLVGIERSRQESASLFYVRWNGVSWVDRESAALGYDPAPESGATAIWLPNGRLGVFYRVRAPQAGGGVRYLAGYISRPVAAGPAVAAATFTPVPSPSAAEAQVGATRTPLPTPDLANLAPPTVDSTVRTQIGMALAAIVLVSGFAIFRLWRGRR